METTQTTTTTTSSTAATPTITTIAIEEAAVSNTVLEPPRPIEDGFPLHDETTLDNLRRVLEDLLSFDTLRGHVSEIFETNKNNTTADPASPAAILAAMDDRLTVPAAYFIHLPAVRAVMPCGVNEMKRTRILIAAAQRSRRVEIIATATETRFGPAPHASSRARCTLHIQGIDKNVNFKDVQRAVGQYDIFHFHRASSDALFVTFEDARSAKAAFVELQGKSLGECHAVQVKMRVGVEKQPHFPQEHRRTHTDPPPLHLRMRSNPRFNSAVITDSIQTPNTNTTTTTTTTTTTSGGGSSNSMLNSTTSTTGNTNTAGCIPPVSPIDTYIDPIRVGGTPPAKTMRTPQTRRGNNNFQSTSSQTRGSMLPRPRGAMQNMRDDVRNGILSGQLSREMCLFMLQEYMMNAAAMAANQQHHHHHHHHHNNNNNININAHNASSQHVPLASHNIRTSCSFSGVSPPCPVGADAYNMKEEYDAACGMTPQDISRHFPMPVDANMMGVEDRTLQPNTNYHINTTTDHNNNNNHNHDNNTNNNNMNYMHNMHNDNNDSNHNCRRRMQRDPYKGGIYVESPIYEENHTTAFVPPLSLLRDPPHRIHFWANRHLNIRDGSGSGSSAIPSPNTLTPPQAALREEEEQEQEREEQEEESIVIVRGKVNNGSNNNNNNNGGNASSVPMKLTTSGNDDESPPSLTPSGASSQLSGGDENRVNATQQQEEQQRHRDKVGSMTYADVIRTSRVVGAPA